MPHGFIYGHSADFEVSDWPTSGANNPDIPGELAWPVEHYRTVSGEIPYSHPASEILNASVSGRYLDINNKLYEKSNYVGLRGLFKTTSHGHDEDVTSLRRYVLWRWVGYAPGNRVSAADYVQLAELDREFRNTASAEAAEPDLPATRHMYFYDGVTL